MTADTSNQIAELRKAATCVYIAVEEGVAKDLSRVFSAAAQTIHDQSAALAERDREVERQRVEILRWNESRDLWIAKAEAAESSLAERDSRYNSLVMAVMRGSHREARDLCRADFVALCPEEREHASKARSDAQRAEAAEARVRALEEALRECADQLTLLAKDPKTNWAVQLAERALSPAASDEGR